jgi:1,4-dihydroxy-2-naphthoate octaprenyltransferase
MRMSIHPLVRERVSHMSIGAYAGVARLPFLILPFALVANGASAAAYDGRFDWVRTILALVGLVALHAAVNTLNETSDFRTGIDLATRRTPFSGGSGTLPSGLLSLRAATVFGWACVALGFLIGAWFLWVLGPSFIPFILVGLFLVVGYTGFLARIGLGEIAAGLGLGSLPVIGTALVQAGDLGPAAYAASVPAFFMTFNLLFLNEFPDVEADRAGGRKNLVLLLGRRRAAWVYALLALATPVSVAGGVLLGFLPPACLIAILPSILLVRPLAWAFRRPEEPVPIPALAANVIWNLATNAALASGFIASIALGSGRGA